MKVGILTQPLRTNYGGLLQAWALQRVLTSLGHDVCVIRRQYSRRRDLPFWRRILSYGKRTLLGLLSKRPFELTEPQKAYISKYTTRFVANRYGGLSPELYSSKALNLYVKKAAFDAYVIGSDQVWRPKYSPDIATFFLDFCKHQNRIKRIAYAASFSVDSWEYTPQQTTRFRALVGLFDKITVREDSGVKLCAQYLGVDAEHVLDPTLLINKEEYLWLVDHPTSDLRESDGELFCYVLDSTEHLQRLLDSVARESGLHPYFCNACDKPTREMVEKSLADCVFPPVEQWLKSFADAKLVLTDSFHGCVFSILFNKPFWVVVNTTRGAARIESLLRMFALEDRMIDDNVRAHQNWMAPIDWQKVNDRLKTMKNSSIKAFSYLNK